MNNTYTEIITAFKIDILTAGTTQNHLLLGYRADVSISGLSLFIWKLWLTILSLNDIDDCWGDCRSVSANDFHLLHLTCDFIDIPLAGVEARNHKNYWTNLIETLCRSGIRTKEDSIIFWGRFDYAVRSRNLFYLT